jgi:hypothetical protein
LEGDFPRKKSLAKLASALNASLEDLKQYDNRTYAELEEEDTDLKELQCWFEKIRILDFYGATLAEEAAKRLRGCEELLDAYGLQVFEAHNENR